MVEDIRIDKWLWSVRLYKTRSIATEECKKGRITIDGIAVKPSRAPKIGDIVKVRKNPVTYSFLIKGMPASRVGARLVVDYLEDITPPEELQILQMQKDSGYSGRDRGTGRPTKKDRRDLDVFLDW
jgi:ribosome-associated heat shock protein Hsp15